MKTLKIFSVWFLLGALCTLLGFIYGRHVGFNAALKNVTAGSVFPTGSNVTAGCISQVGKVWVYSECAPNCPGPSRYTYVGQYCSDGTGAYWPERLDGMCYLTDKPK